jgi:outer membrane lipoprotein carrier protein
MTRFLIALVLLVSLDSSAQSFTKVNDPSLCKKKINTHIKSTSSIIANFSEENYSSMFNSVKTAKGILIYKQTDKIRWEHTSPKKQLILIDGTNVRLKENGKEINNATTKRVVKKVQSLMIQLFNGKFLNEKEFNISYYENKSYYKLILKPKNSRMSKYISQIEMIFDKKILSMHQLILKETEEDKIVYTFSSVKFNQSVSDSNFKTF